MHQTVFGTASKNTLQSLSRIAQGSKRKGRNRHSDAFREVYHERRGRLRAALLLCKTLRGPFFTATLTRDTRHQTSNNEADMIRNSDICRHCVRSFGFHPEENKQHAPLATIVWRNATRSLIECSVADFEKVSFVSYQRQQGDHDRRGKANEQMH